MNILIKYHCYSSFVLSKIRFPCREILIHSKYSTSVYFSSENKRDKLTIHVLQAQDNTTVTQTLSHISQDDLENRSGAVIVPDVPGGGQVSGGPAAGADGWWAPQRGLQVAIKRRFQNQHILVHPFYSAFKTNYYLQPTKIHLAVFWICLNCIFCMIKAKWRYVLFQKDWVRHSVPLLPGHPLRGPAGGLPQVSLHRSVDTETGLSLVESLQLARILASHC